MYYGAYSRPKSGTRHFDWPYNEWDRPSPRKSKSAANAIGVRQPSRRPRGWLTGECSNIFSSAGFPDSPLVISAQQWIWSSFGPIYARGLLHRGQFGFAVIGVNAAETPASIDAMLILGILWLDACRQSQAGKLIVEGIKLLLPAGTSRLTRERMAYLNVDAAKWHLYELNHAKTT
jgi:hypothetical protein